MTPTTLLYHTDPLLMEFSASVVGHATLAGKPSLVLDRTAFYPESGGQMADHGSLGQTNVTDVQIDEHGVVHHLYAGPPPDVGAWVSGTVDRQRRRVHMALHTGQHMLSRALVDVAKGETVSSRLGETSCTIDIDRERLEERDVARAEDLVNSVVEDDVPIRAWFPDAEELSGLALRRAPKVEDHVRVVAIGEFDVSPCGGTHCVRSSQVGLLRVTGIERYKGKIRLTFASGRRARLELAAHDDVLRGLSRELTCGPAEVPVALAKLRRDLQETREALGQSRTRLAAAVAADLVARALAEKRVVVAELFVGVDADFVRAVAKRVTAEPRLAVVLGAQGTDGIHVVVARGSQSSTDCGALLKRLASAGGGRGGGSPERAEGRLPGDANWPVLLVETASHTPS